MKRVLQGLLIVVLFLAPAGRAHAETVAGIPAPTGYINDFANVLSPATKQNLEALATQVDRQAHAQIAVATIKTLENDQPVDDFANRLFEKWKVGAKGTDRGILMVIVLNPRRRWIEVGYGLEGILNDARVGDIGRSMVPYLSAGNYDQGITTGVQQIAQIIAADAGVTLTGVPPPQHYYHRETQTASLSPLQLLVVGGVILVVVILLASTGNLGLLFFLLANLMGGGGGGDRRRGGGGGGGGFGGFGGGSSGGGGAGGDY
jgi:uncharacterized protein